MEYKSDRELLLFTIKMTLEMLSKPPKSNDPVEEMQLELVSLYTLRDSFNKSITTLERELGAS